MDNKTECIFADASVTFEQFTNELAVKIALKLYQVQRGELEISQAQAFKMFGRADVERWVKSGKIAPCRISPGKKRFKLVELQKLASIQQNYLL